MIHSVSRAALNRVLIEAAARHGAAFRFMQVCTGIDLASNHLCLRDASSGLDYTVGLSPTIAADGAGSVVRGHLAAAGLTVVREDRLDHDYKELSIPSSEGKFALEPHALHIWPRGGFMLIALPNLDGRFTATLFLERDGETSFAGLATSRDVRQFLTRQFPDLGPLAPDMTAEFAASARAAVHGARVAVARRRQRVVAGRCGPCDRAVSRSGHECAFEDCATLEDLLGNTMNGGFVRGIRSAASSECRRDRANGPRKLRGNARVRCSIRDSSPQGHLTRARERFPERPRAYSMVMSTPNSPMKRWAAA